MLSSTRRTRLNRRTFLRGAAGAALGTSILGSLNVRGQSTVKIGVILPEAHPGGRLAKEGASFATQVINNSMNLSYPQAIGPWEGIPSLNNAKLELVFGDDQGNPERGGQLVRELKAEGAVGILGAMNSDVTEAVIRESIDVGLPVVNYISTRPNLTKEGNDLFFRINSDTVQGLKAFFAAVANFMGELSESEKANVPKNYLWVSAEYPGVNNDIRPLAKVDDIMGG